MRPHYVDLAPAVKHGTFEEQASIGGLYRVHNSILDAGFFLKLRSTWTPDYYLRCAERKILEDGGALYPEGEHFFIHPSSN